MRVDATVTDAADEASGLIAVAASTEEGERQLRYLPEAATTAVPAADAQRTEARFAATDLALKLHMPDSFVGSSHAGSALEKAAQPWAPHPKTRGPGIAPRFDVSELNPGSNVCQGLRGSPQILVQETP